MGPAATARKALVKKNGGPMRPAIRKKLREHVRRRERRPNEGRLTARCVSKQRPETPVGAPASPPPQAEPYLRVVIDTMTDFRRLARSSLVRGHVGRRAPVVGLRDWRLIRLDDRRRSFLSRARRDSNPHLPRGRR